MAQVVKWRRLARMKQRSESGEPASEPANSLQLPTTNRFKLKAQTAKKDLLDQQDQQDPHPAEAKENYHWLNSYCLVTIHRETVKIFNL
jgi:hypothetical protein